MQKRKLCALTLSAILAFVLLFCGCKPIPEQKIKVYQGFSVHYLDVGQGDCIFIKFNDGKNMLIDTGVNDVRGDVFKFVNAYLNAHGVSKIDYLILTHPDSDHIGNAIKIIDAYQIGRAYIPYISERLIDSTFPQYASVVNELNKKQIEMAVSTIFNYIVGDDYQVAFLSPAQQTAPNGSYGQLNGATVPDDSMINNISPIIYLQFEDTRFIFTGDALKSQEEYVVDNYRSGLYSSVFDGYGITVNLMNIDFLKVGHHGAENSTGEKFLTLLRPKNAIISVSENNAYGQPSSNVLSRLLVANPDYSLYRTDVNGTIVVHKSNGNMRVTVQSTNSK